MSVQRFCPLCDRSFQEGEAVLRCDGCGVLHHPGCWVTNGGCATQSEHKVSPSAMAYTANERISGSPAPHPGEGTRSGPMAPPPAEIGAPEPIPFRATRPPIHETSPAPDDGPVIGAAAPAPMIHRTLPSTAGTPPLPRRYQPPPGEHMPRKTMPQIYDRPRILTYWYVPVAALLAIVVAFGVIWSVDELTGGDSKADADPTPAATQPAGGITTVQPTSAITTPLPTQSAVATTRAGKFKGGEAVIVTGTGDCLNVRVKAGRENDAIVCVKDGTELVVTGGPELASDLTWWKVRTDLGEGWAAEDYLNKKP